jgi:large subunit ribosomal protein L4
MPKKAWQRALCLAISDRARAGKLKIVETLELNELKTKAAKSVLDELGMTHALIVLGEGEEKFIRAARNLAAHKVLPVNGINVYDVLNYAELLLTVKAARALESRLGEHARESARESAGESANE